MMEFALEQYEKKYAPNTRETFRRQTMHQFVAAGLVLYNPDKPDRSVNSTKAGYQIEPATLALIRDFGTKKWTSKLAAYLTEHQTLIARYARERKHNLIPVVI